MIKDKCLRCGQCCQIIVEGKAYPCRFLRFRPDETTYCKVYRGRLGRPIAPGWKCILRKNTHYDFPGCPYNTNKPMFNKENFK